MTESSAGPAGPELDRGRLDAFMTSGKERVEAALERTLPAAGTAPESLHRAMRHSLFAGGKRVRPLLTLAAGRACGADIDDLLPAACAVELIHTYSLIHDDLPAFDDEELRRGQPTCHVLFGETIAILAGDALQALAFEQLAAAASGADAPERWLDALRVIARAAGSIGMCGGQTFDVEAAGSSLQIEELKRLHAAKTGALLTASVLSGAILAGASEPRRRLLGDYGDAIGLAFQVVDDMLDVEGDEADLGKRPGGDADREQPTFPSLLGLEETRREARALHRRALAALEEFGDEADLLRDLAGFIVERSR